jgi:hypothetical protein
MKRITSVVVLMAVISSSSSPSCSRVVLDSSVCSSPKYGFKSDDVVGWLVGDARNIITWSPINFVSQWLHCTLNTLLDPCYNSTDKNIHTLRRNTDCSNISKVVTIWKSFTFVTESINMVIPEPVMFLSQLLFHYFLQHMLVLSLHH